MNNIFAKLDKCDYELYKDRLNYQIDGFWLDEKLEELYPHRMFQALIPTLFFAMDIPKEEKLVWSRINPLPK